MVALPSPLLSAANLRDRHMEPDLVVVDCRFDLMDPAAGRRAYQAGHIPGARYADLNRDLSSPVTPGVTGRHPLPDPDLLADKLGAWGISGSSHVVAYDDVSGAIAARLWWLLHWLGHKSAVVLDGGLTAWKAAGGELDQGEPSPAPAVFAAHLQPDLVVQVDRVVTASQAGSLPLLDARAEPRFYGDVEPIDAIPGHIPGARSLPFGSLLDSGHFAAPDKVRATFEQALAGAPASEAICYCGSGVTACHLLLGAVHAGLPMPRLYAGSYSEWITDPERAVQRR